MSDYGINLKLNLEGNNKLRTLYQDFKNLETQINKTQQTIKDLTRKNKELKLEQSNLGAAIVGVGKGAEVTVKFIKALAETFFINKKAVKESNKEIREARKALKGLKEEAAVARKNTLDNAKAFQTNSGILKESTGALRRYIEEWERLLNTTRAKDKGTKNTLIDSITKADFTLQFKQLDAYVKKIDRVAYAYKQMAGGEASQKFGAFRGMGNLLGFDPGKTEAGIKSYIRVLENLRQQLDRTGKEYREVTVRIRQMNKELEIQPGIATPTGYTADQYGPKQAMFGERTFARMTSGNKQFQKGGMFYEPGGYGRRRSGALNSALIGGAFPALFGQGLGASIGGGLGGGIGGLLGGGLGFGGSLVGTQIGAQFDRLVQSMNKAGTALADFNKDTDKLIESLGLTNSQTALRIKNLKQLNGEQAAYEAALAQTTAIIGKEGVQGLKTFGDETRQINTDFQQLFLMMGASLARLISFTRILKGLTDGINNSTLGGRLSAANDPRATALASEIEGLEGGTSGRYSSRLTGKQRRRLRQAREEARELLKTIELENTRREGFKLITKEMEKQQKINNTFGFRERERIANAEKVNELAKEYYGLTKEALSDEQRAKLEAMVAAQSELVLGTQLLAEAYTEVDKELIQLMDSGYQVKQAAEAIGSAFSESFKGIVKGTMSVQQAFANMFSRIADSFLDMAAQMIAKQIQMKILGIGLNLFTGGTQANMGTGRDGTFGLGTHGSGIPTGAKGWGFSGRAAGGPVSGGTPYVVGEKGPELFVPGSSGNIVPNHAMGGTNVVVNVDASGSSVEGEEEQARELGDMLAAAIQSEIIKQKRPGGLLA